MTNKSYWMWYWGEFEIYHTFIMSGRREEYGADYPTMWHNDVAYPTVEFLKTVTLEKEGYLLLRTNGKGYVTVDGKRHKTGDRVTLTPGTHRILIRVTKDGGFPCVWVESDVCPSGEGWECTRAAMAERVPAAWMEQYDSPDVTPETFLFSYKTVRPLSRETLDGGVLIDFGKEMFGILNVSGLNPAKKTGIFYGESREEALGGENAIVFEYTEGKKSVRLRPRAFRYIFVQGGDDSVRVSAKYEYLPLKQRGSFRCDNELFNRIWETCRYTFHLCCRETYLDGIKRDRWPWSGDAYQSYLINRYLFMDQAIDQRTILGLRGKDPTEQHINTILDYSLYWILDLEKYYVTYGDREFVERCWKRALTLMEFVATRENEHGFLVGQDGDWTFVDWTEMDKTGAVCAEQMLYVRALRAMSSLSALLGEDGSAWQAASDALLLKINEFYWDPEKGAYIDSYESGRRNVTRHANIFALLFDIADPAQHESIVENVLLSDSVRKITTPYFEGFELDAMCRIGNFTFFEDMLTSYWGSMLELGATTVWEEYYPTMQGAEHYAMYGKPFGKSLCHAWGCTPVYLFGRYYLGVSATAPGYTSFDVEPQLGGLGEIEGTVPVGSGEVYVRLSKKELIVSANVEGGTLVWDGRRVPLKAGEKIHILL